MLYRTDPRVYNSDSLAAVYEVYQTSPGSEIYIHQRMSDFSSSLFIQYRLYIYNQTSGESIKFAEFPSKMPQLKTTIPGLSWSAALSSAPDLACWFLPGSVEGGACWMTVAGTGRGTEHQNADTLSSVLAWPSHCVHLTHPTPPAHPR